MALTNKQRAFIDHYLLCWNASEAARRAGYSEKTARSIGQENLTKPAIRQEIQKVLQERAMGVDEALKILADMGRGSMSDFVEVVDGIRQPYIKITTENAHLVKEFEQDATGRIKVKLEDRQAAIDKIMKAHGAYLTRAEIKTDVSHSWQKFIEEQDADPSAGDE